MACMCFDRYEKPKLSTNTDLSTPFLIQLVMLLILTINIVTDKMLLCGGKEGYDGVFTSPSPSGHCTYIVRTLYQLYVHCTYSARWATA